MMSEENIFNIEKYLLNGIIVDTNLLILFLIGIYDSRYISKFKITCKYSEEDFKILKDIVKGFKKIIITPHIVAELSNLSMKIPENRLKEYFKYFIEILKKSDEINIDKNSILLNKYIDKIGVTDVGIMLASENNEFLFITDDFQLANISFSKGLPVINFNHIREFLWFGR